MIAYCYPANDSITMPAHVVAQLKKSEHDPGVASATTAHEQELERRVCRLLAERNISEFSQVSARVIAGRVLLRGVVRTYYAKQLAQECARRVAGVRYVCNEVEVALPTLHVPKQRMHPSSALTKQAGMLLAVSLIALIGCNASVDERTQVFPVEGTVSFGDKSLEGALIVLHPKANSDPEILPARGYANAAGEFTLTTYESGDGAAAGEYNVTVVHTPLIQRDGDFLAGPNVLPHKYATPLKTDLTASISDGSNSLPVLELKR